MHERESEGIGYFLGRQLFGVFEVEEWQVQGAAVRVRGNLLAQPETALTILRQRLEPGGFIPLLSTPRANPNPPRTPLRQRLEPVGFIPLLSSPREILILPMPAGVQRGVTEKPWPQILLFVITIFTTLFVGALGQGPDS